MSSIHERCPDHQEMLMRASKEAYLKPSPCYHCDHAIMVENFEQPIGCSLEGKPNAFSQAVPQPVVCSERQQVVRAE